MIEAAALAAMTVGGACGGVGVGRVIATALRWDRYRAWSLRRLCGVTGMAGAAAIGLTEARAEPPAAVATGYWTGDVRMSSSPVKAPNAGYWWVGQMWGRIDGTGKLLMRAENGCVTSGVVGERHASDSLRGEVQVSDCREPSMNRRYEVHVIRVTSAADGRWADVRLDAKAQDAAPGVPGYQGRDEWRIEGTLMPYTPKK